VSGEDGGDGALQRISLQCRIGVLDELDYNRNGGIPHDALRKPAA
jgi:aconitate hydratase